MDRITKIEGIWKKDGSMQVYEWKMDEMNMTRTMGCKICIACQDQRYERIMEVCRKMYGWIKGK